MKILNPHISDQEALILMSRFLDGDTTIKEEKKLYSYFRRRHIHPELEEHREMMHWYADGMRQAKQSPISAAWRGAIAAMLIAVVCLGVGKLSHPSPNDALYASYEGSYVMINGKKVTNIKKIMPYLQDTELLAKNVFDMKAFGESYFDKREAVDLEMEQTRSADTSIADEMAKFFDNK